ncbi:MAG: M55 family metallopeptidase [Gaiellales bacterium]
MKIFLSSDIEGTAGIVDWGQVLGSGEYEMGRRLLLNEVNAAIDGAIAGGAREVVVNDSHWTMQNLPPAELHGRASSISGKHKPHYMMEGLDGSFDAVFFVSYHGSISAERAILSHTYNPSAVHEARLNGVVAGESAINALVALHHAVPVALITGDEATVAEAEPFMPGIEGVVVKRSITRFAAHSLHPEEACERIREGAERALERLSSLAPPRIELPARLDVTFLTADMAEMATWVGGIERTSVRSVRIQDADPLAVYRRFVTVIALTRVIAERV